VQFPVRENTRENLYFSKLPKEASIQEDVIDELYELKEDTSDEHHLCLLS